MLNRGEHCLWLAAGVGLVYLLGTTGSDKGSAIAISRSEDGGLTWRQAVLFPPPEDCGYHTGVADVAAPGEKMWRNTPLAMLPIPCTPLQP